MWVSSDHLALSLTFNRVHAPVRQPICFPPLSITARFNSIPPTLTAYDQNSGEALLGTRYLYHHQNQESDGKDTKQMHLQHAVAIKMESSKVHKRSNGMHVAVTMTTIVKFIIYFNVKPFLASNWWERTWNLLIIKWNTCWSTNMCTYANDSLLWKAQLHIAVTVLLRKQDVSPCNIEISNSLQATFVQKLLSVRSLVAATLSS